MRLRLIPGRRRRARRGARRLRGFRSPLAQAVYACALALFGAWLIAIWVVGLLLIVFALLIAVDALLRDAGEDRRQPQSRHEEIIERWRNAR